MLTNLINDLLDLAKLNNLKFKFNNQYFDIENLFHNVVETVKYIADQKNILV